MRFILYFTISLCLLSGSLHADSPAILVSDAWINEAPPVGKINAAYLFIKNNTDHAVTLDRIDSPDYERIEIHRSIVTDDIVRMQLQTQVDIAANSLLQFTPGDYHLMLFNPRKRFRAGESASLTLYFSDGEQISVEARVKRFNPDKAHPH